MKRAGGRVVDLAQFTVPGLSQTAALPSHDQVAVHEAHLAFQQVHTNAAEVAAVGTLAGLKTEEAAESLEHRAARLGNGSRGLRRERGGGCTAAAANRCLRANPPA